MARTIATYYPASSVHVIQPVAYFPADVPVSQQPLDEIMQMMEALSDFVRDDLGGYTFRYDDIISYQSQTITTATMHWQNAVWETPRVAPCDKRRVFFFAACHPAGVDLGPVGTVGPPYWGCLNQIPPGRVLTGWVGMPHLATYGAALHELGHCWGLGHPVEGSPQASGHNIMGGGWMNYPNEGFHVTEKDYVRSLPWFRRR